VAVLPSLGLEIAIGLSSEDPIGARRPSEAYEAFLSRYVLGGRLPERRHLGTIPPHRRRLFDITSSGASGAADHLAVAHRIPQRLLEKRTPDDVVELVGDEFDYAMFRSLVQYSYPGGSNGSVIYETPPNFNAPRPGRPPASTLTFTSKIVVGDDVTTCIALIHYSVDPSYTATAPYRYAVLAPDGERIVTGAVDIPPFSVRVLDIGRACDRTVRERHRDPVDGLAWLGYVGYCREAAVIPLILTLAPRTGAVAVEHTHPAQAYTLPARPEDKHKVKIQALQQWAAMLASERVGTA